MKSKVIIAIIGSCLLAAGVATGYIAKDHINTNDKITVNYKESNYKEINTNDIDPVEKVANEFKKHLRDNEEVFNEDGKWIYKDIFGYYHLILEDSVKSTMDLQGQSRSSYNELESDKNYSASFDFGCEDKNK